MPGLFPASMASTLPRASPDLPPDFAKMTAPLLFATLFNWAFYGALCVQVYVYSYNFPEDKRILKALAYVVFLLETAQTILTGADVYFWFIEGFGDAEIFQHSHYAPIDLPIMDAIISFIVQEYFCYRIWALTRNRPSSSWFWVVIAFVSTLQAVGAAWGGVKSLMLGKFAVSRAAFFLWSISSIVADVLIAIGMTMIFRQARVNGSRFTNFALLRLVRLTVETNALTTGVALSAFLLYVACPNKIYYTLPVGIIGKVYSNTLLVSLNNRIYFRDRGSPGVTVHGDSSDRGVVASNPSSSHRAIAIHVTQVKQPPSQAMTGGAFEMGIISHTMERAKDERDGVSIGSDPS